jgi:hypothetical protein
VNAPGDKRNAAPAEAEDGSFGKHENGSTASPAAQAAESPLMGLIKSWMRAAPTDRALFLSDVRAGSPNLWREIDRETQEGTGPTRCRGGNTEGSRR